VKDATERAYSQLGLLPGASADRLRKQYKALVRRWHPDRFAGDPQGQAEAAIRMRAINDAYHLILRRISAATTQADPVPHARARGEALTRE
jgi:DnaJ-class molecular chaperone